MMKNQKLSLDQYVKLPRASAPHPTYSGATGNTQIGNFNAYLHPLCAPNLVESQPYLTPSTQTSTFEKGTSNINYPAPHQPDYPNGKKRESYLLPKLPSVGNLFIN
jgi:hypothetical protein